MRSPEQVLKALNKHGKVSDYKFERLYRILFNEEMFHVAYQRIYAKPGNMTPGTDGKTINRMSLQRLIRQKGYTYPRKTVRKDRLEFLPLRTNLYRRWCA